MPRHTPTLLIAVTLIGLTACSTTEKPADIVPMAAKLPPPPAVLPANPVAPVTSPALAASSNMIERIADANAVYVARVRRDGEFEHYFITDVWRHDPAFGPAPEPASVWAPGLPHRASHGDWNRVLICLAASPHGHTTSVMPILHDRFVGNRTLESVRAAVAAGHVAAPMLVNPHRPTLDEAVAKAREVYLVRIDTSTGLVHYIVQDVWRHDPARPALEIGTEALPSDHRKASSAITYGTHAVIFMLPSRSAPGMPSSFVMSVLNGYVGGSATVAEVHDRVVNADPALLSSKDTGRR